MSMNCLSANFHISNHSGSLAVTISREGKCSFLTVAMLVYILQK